jgi:hypothetical protein
VQGGGQFEDGLPKKIKMDNDDSCSGIAILFEFLDIGLNVVFVGKRVG